MLYKKNSSPSLTEELFKNPTAEYRGTPFWAWNNLLTKEELCRQIDVFKEMGLGGFHMHVRVGMSTEYLSDGFMSFIKGCVNTAKDKKEFIDIENWFGREAPLYLEIGCGKGKFACEYAKTHPEINLIAVEKTANVIVGACENAQKENIDNLYFIGDGAGKAGNIVVAAATGLISAKDILERIKKGEK